MSNEIGISLNPKCKELIDQFIQKEFPKNPSEPMKEKEWDFFISTITERITSLVEACIYADNHDPVGTIITKEPAMNEMEIIKMVWGTRPVYDMAKVITALSIALKQNSPE